MLGGGAETWSDLPPGNPPIIAATVPNADGLGWAGKAGRAVASTVNWNIRVYAICANVAP